MAEIRFKNNATTTLSGAISEAAGSLIVASAADSNKFPGVIPNGPPELSPFFYATIYDSDPAIFEIVKVTNRQNNDATWSINRAQEGTTARLWGAGAKIEHRITAASLDALKHPKVDVQHFVTPGSSAWLKPVGAKLVFFQLWGGGGGGGPGRRRSIASQGGAAFGGSGGSGGAYNEFWEDAGLLAEDYTVLVGSGGIGRPGVTSDNTSGLNGGTGGNSSVGGSNLYEARGGPGGNAGQATGGTQPQGAPRGFCFVDQTGAALNGRGGLGGADGGSSGVGQNLGGGGGGGGRGYQGSSVTGGSGGNGGPGGWADVAGSGGSPTGDPNGVNGGPTTTTPTDYLLGGIGPAGARGGGGGGGGATVNFTSGQASPPGGNGGNGGWPGGGGGGGGASQASTSGAGGSGGSGYVRITTFF